MGESAKLPLYEEALKMAQVPVKIDAHTGQIQFRTQGSWGKCYAGKHCVLAVQKAKETGYTPKPVEGAICSDLEESYWCGACWLVGLSEHSKFAENNRKLAAKGKAKEKAKKEAPKRPLPKANGRCRWASAVRTTPAQLRVGTAASSGRAS